MDALLKRAWESSANFLCRSGKHLLYVARNLVAWCEQLLEHFQEKGDEAEVLDSVGLITKAAAYLADASVDTVRTRARSTTLINSDQRAV